MRGQLATFNVANLVLGISVVEVFALLFHLGHAAEREEGKRGVTREEEENKRGVSWSNSRGSTTPSNFTSRLVPSHLGGLTLRHA